MSIFMKFYFCEIYYTPSGKNFIQKRTDIPIAPSLYSLSNKMGNSLLAVREINYKCIVVDKNLFDKQNVVFPDRDGTITKEVGLVCGIDSLELLPRAVKTAKKINILAYYCIVVTNQPAIARGIMTDSELNDWSI